MKEFLSFEQTLQHFNVVAGEDELFQFFEGLNI
jgi:hypothetical protein